MKIEFEIENKKYTLEYSRDSIRKLEDRGYNFQELESKPITMMSVLFFGALLKHQPETNLEQSDELYKQVADDALMAELDNMFADCVKLGASKNPNVKWKKVR